MRERERERERGKKRKRVKETDAEELLSADALRKPGLAVMQQGFSQTRCYVDAYFTIHTRISISTISFFRLIANYRQVNTVVIR